MDTKATKATAVGLETLVTDFANAALPDNVHTHDLLVWVRASDGDAQQISLTRFGPFSNGYKRHGNAMCDEAHDQVSVEDVLQGREDASVELAWERTTWGRYTLLHSAADANRAITATARFKEELMQAAWHPRRFADWCLDESEKADLMPLKAQPDDGGP